MMHPYNLCVDKIAKIQHDYAGKKQELGVCVCVTFYIKVCALWGAIEESVFILA